MKYFVFSDLHGCIKELKDELNKVGFDKNNSEHILLFLGDAFDHNKEGHYETYLFFKEMIDKKKLIWIYGNHEIYLLNVLKKMKPNKFTADTVRNIAVGLVGDSINYSDEDCLKVLKNHGVYELIKDNCIDYFELKNYVFTHGFIPYNKKDNKYSFNWRNVSSDKWNYYRCMNGQKIVLGGVHIPDKTLVCGHIGSYYGNIIKTHPDYELDGNNFNKLKSRIMRNVRDNIDYFNIYYGAGVIGLDSRSYDTHKVNVLIIEE